MPETFYSEHLRTTASKNNKFTTSVYGKLTFSGAFTNFASFIPLSYKSFLVNTFLFRYFTLCGLMKNFITKLFIRKIFLNTTDIQIFSFIDSCIKLFFDKLCFKLCLR